MNCRATLEVCVVSQASEIPNKEVNRKNFLIQNIERYVVAFY